MGAGFHGGFGNTGGANDSEDYNPAGSKSVGKVETVNNTNDLHNIPEKGESNSVTRNHKDGKLTSERYYDDDGNAYLDIDYTNHGNSKTHPKVPHEHDIWIDDNGNFHRGKDKEIKK